MSWAVTRMLWVRFFHFSDKNIHRDVVLTTLKVPKFMLGNWKQRWIQFLGNPKGAFGEWVKKNSAPHWLKCKGQIQIYWKCFPWFSNVRHWYWEVSQLLLLFTLIYLLSENPLKKSQVPCDHIFQAHLPPKTNQNLPLGGAQWTIPQLCSGELSVVPRSIM